MRIIGFNISKILAEKQEEAKGKIEIKSNINIDNIKEEKIGISENPTLRFDFTFSLDYEPKLAKIEIKGSVLVMDESKESKEVLKDWKKKKFNHAIKLPLFNFIMNKCNIKALQLEEELNLMHHIPMPKLSAQTNPNPDSKNDNPANYAG